MALDINNLLGSASYGPNYKQVNTQAEANALNAQGYQVANVTERADGGGGTWLMQRIGPNPGNITASLLSQYVNAFNTGPQEIAGLGATASRDINEGAQRASASINQSAMSRGLSNNSAIMSLQRGVEESRVRSQLALNESLRRQALDYQFSALDKIGDLALGLSQLPYTGSQLPNTPALSSPTSYVQPKVANPNVASSYGFSR